MRYNICHSCQYFCESVKTPFERTPNRCLHPDVVPLYGLEVGGFPGGIDIFRCEYYNPFPLSYGDVAIQTEKGGILSYVIPSERLKKQQFVLTDNIKNIRLLKIKSYDGKNKPHFVEKNPKGLDSRSFGSSGCPF